MKHLISSIVTLLSTVWIGFWIWSIQNEEWWVIPSLISLAFMMCIGFGLLIIGLLELS